MSKLIFNAVAGLGDRIITTMSFYNYAIENNIDFEVIWNLNFRCNSKLELLFDVDFNYQYGNDIPYNYINTNKIFIDRTNVDFIKNNINKNINILECFIDHNSSKWYEFFRPKKYITDIVYNYIITNFINKKVLGIHIRALDKYQQKDKFNKYLETIDKYINNYDKIFLATDDGGKLYLSKNQIKLSRHFHENYNYVDKIKEIVGDKLIIYPKQPVDRNIENSIIESVIELLILQKTNFIIGDNNSNYSKLAVADKSNILI